MTPPESCTLAATGVPGAQGLPEANAVTLDEATHIRETLAGNPRAFGVLVQTHHRRVYNFLYQLLRQREDAEDLTQQTFLKAFQNLHRFQLERPLINWLLTIARHAAYNHCRDRKRWTELSSEVAASEPSPATAAEKVDSTTNLWDRARNLLAPRDFEILWLRFGDGLSIEETAQIVGLTKTHVKVIVHRARKSLLEIES